MLLAAGDTFRAAAAQQLEIWSKKIDVPIIMKAQGTDPSSVIFDAVESEKARGFDIVICDTAGRLHNKINLMTELSKIKRVMEK